MREDSRRHSRRAWRRRCVPEHANAKKPASLRRASTEGETPMSTERIFDHVLIIVFENEYHSYVHANPYMKSLAAKGADLANHFGNMHPSQTNYISSVAGELCNITYDWPP